MAHGYVVTHEDQSVGGPERLTQRLLTLGLDRVTLTGGANGEKIWAIRAALAQKGGAPSQDGLIAPTPAGTRAA